MKLSNVYIICIVLMAFFTQSCSKMNDLHQKYLDEGEIIYAAKVDSVAPRAGKNRIQLEMFIVSQRIKTVRIFWNDYKDSVDVAIDSKTGVFKKQLENMAEKGYIFQFVSIDEFGHKSLPFEVTGNVYGDTFQAILFNRTIKDVTSLENGVLTISWSGAVDKGLRCDLVYTNIAGTQVIKSVPMTELTTVLPDLASDLKYRTLFLPEPTAIDTFYTDYKTIPIIVEAKVSKTDWKITGFDTEEPAEGAPNGLATAAIDDNLNTYWHSQWSGANPPYPHWFSIDMGKEVTISCIEVFRRQGNNGGQTKHQFLYSDNGTDWTDFGTFPMDVNTDSGQKFRSATNPTARYIKYVALEGPNFYAFLAELNVYTPL